MKWPRTLVGGARWGSGHLRQGWAAKSTIRFACAGGHPHLLHEVDQRHEQVVGKAARMGTGPRLERQLCFHAAPASTASCACSSSLSHGRAQKSMVEQGSLLGDRSVRFCFTIPILNPMAFLTKRSFRRKKWARCNSLSRGRRS